MHSSFSPQNIEYAFYNLGVGCTHMYKTLEQHDLVTTMLLNQRLSDTWTCLYTKVQIGILFFPRPIKVVYYIYI